MIVAGFQGVSGGSETTTLGRGGSDTTAVALAGAGIKGGAVVGKTNATGTAVTDREVYSGHLFHTYLQAVGVDSKSELVIGGRKVPLADPSKAAITELLA